MRTKHDSSEYYYVWTKYDSSEDLSMIVVRTKHDSSEDYYVWTEYASGED